MKIAIIDKIGLCYDGYTLNNSGLGGSESAVILIAKNLQRIGLEVTVFNNCIDSKSSEGIFNGVRYVDISKISQYDEKFDIVIVSRTVAPFLESAYQHIISNANLKILWAHDTFIDGDNSVEYLLVEKKIDYVFTLSDFHSSYILNCQHGRRRNFEVLKDKFFQTRNGAVKYIDEVDLSNKDKNKFVYNASATKGLVPLLDHIWPEIKKLIPKASLTVIGGYYRFREDAQPDEQEKTVKSYAGNYKDQSVTFTGVITQEQIAHIIAKSGWMLYPAAFPETFGISSLESLLYKTPIITNNFGALEETAIDGACYKIDYAIEPNVLFVDINKNQQISKFINLVYQAYHDDYKARQKREYCSIVDDIAGWDTVALQWKQFFYAKLEKYLPVDQYQQVEYINEKVRNVFGRVFNTSPIKTYSSFGPQKPIVVISPFYNSWGYIDKCIDSVASQSYDNYRHILICDNSDDLLVASNHIGNLPESIKSKYVLKYRTERYGALRNQVTEIEAIGDPNTIIMLLDGDDWLINNNTIFHYYNQLHSNHDFTYGSCYSLADSLDLIAQEYSLDTRINKSFKKELFPWNVPYTHLRTFKRFLFDNINYNQLKDGNGNFLIEGGDIALFYELIKNTDPYRIKAVKDVLTVYNDLNPLNDYKVNGETQTKNASLILSR